MEDVSFMKGNACTTSKIAMIVVVHVVHERQCLSDLNVNRIVSSSLQPA